MGIVLCPITHSDDKISLTNEGLPQQLESSMLMMFILHSQNAAGGTAAVAAPLTLMLELFVLLFIMQY